MGLLGPMEVNCKICDNAVKYQEINENKHVCKCMACDCLYSEGVNLLNGGEHDCITALKDRISKMA